MTYEEPQDKPVCLQLNYVDKFGRNITLERADAINYYMEKLVGHVI